jgi:hypothetical protein
MRATSAAAIAASLMLQGCGGGGASAVPPPASPTFGSGSGVSVQAGTVVLPAGSKASLTSLRVNNSLGSVAVSGSGTFGLPAFSSGPQLAQVLNANGNPILMGMLGPTETSLNVHTTAEAMVYLAGGLYQLPDAQRQQAYAAIASAPGFANLETAVSTALSTDPDPFASTTGVSQSNIAAALVSFFGSLGTRSARVAHSIPHRVVPKDLKIDPSNGQSGITPLQASPVQINFANTFRRPARAFIDQVSYGASAGSTTNIFAAALSDVVPPLDVPPATALKSFKSSIGDIALGNYAWAEVATAPQTIVPFAGSFWTRYFVTVVGPGQGPPQAVLSPEQKAAVQDLTLQFVVQQMLLPYVSSVMVPYGDLDKIYNNAFAPAVAKDIISALSADIPNIMAEANKGSYSGALLVALNAIAKSSSAQKAMLDGLVKLSGITDPGIQAQWSKAFASAVSAGLRLADAALVGMDLLKITADISSSNQADAYSVVAIPTKIVLTPASSTVNNGSYVIPSFQVSVPSAGGSGLLLEYSWSNSAKVGKFCDLSGRPDHCDNFTSTVNQGTYLANSTGKGTDTVTVTVTASDFSGDKPLKFPLGSATATVTVSPPIDDAGTPPSNLPQSRCASMQLSPHLVSIGDTITATTSAPHPESCGGDIPPPKPVTWTWGVHGGLTVLSGCGPNDMACSLKAVALTGVPGNRYAQLCLVGDSRQGGWQSCDYYAVANRR